MAIRYTTLDERKEACIRTLVRFLREKGIYFKYQNEVYRQGAHYYHEYDLCKLIKKIGGVYGDGCVFSMTRAFIWSKTKDGLQYWKKIKDSWRDYYGNNIKKQEIYRKND